MKSLFPIFSLFLIAVGLSASPVPYSGKVSVDGVNFNGTADFRFELRDENGTVHWRNAQNPVTSISVPVQNGRYVVLLGGQGMVGLPSQLFVQHPKLWVRVQVDFRDGQGSRLLQPDQRVRSVPHALSANLAKRALSADSVADEGVSARSLDPALKVYLAPLLKPVATGSVSNLDRLEGSAVTLSAPSATGQNLSYQWKKDGNVLSGATAKDLVFSQLQPSHGGSYEVVVSNDFGSFSKQLALGVYSEGTVQVAIGDNHALYIDAMGFLHGMGQNISGEIGTVAGATALPVRLLNDRVTMVKAGVNNSLFLKKDGSLWGLGALGIANVQVPVKVADGPIKSFAGGESCIYVVKGDGSLWSGGYNGNGQLGDGTTQNRSELVKVIDSGVAKVISRSRHAAIIKDDGSLWTFGQNHRGQLGNGTKAHVSQPFRVEASGVVDVSTYPENTIYVKDDGSLWGLGRSHFGMFPSGGDNLHPLKIAEGAISRASLGHFHLLFLKEDGSVWGRGRNSEGQLGLEGSHTNPVQLVASGAVDISTGTDFSVITMADGRIFNFGKNTFGQLGTGEPLYYLSPQKLEGLKVKDVATNTESSYFLDLTGALWSVGQDSKGDLGNGGDSHCLLYTSPSPRDQRGSRMPSSA